jgi:uncharacterized protein YlxP (DUF503 family)
VVAVRPFTVGLGESLWLAICMVVGLLRLEFSIDEAFTLKDKRRVVKSLKDRIGHRFNVSVAEVEALDLIRTGVLGVAMVSNDHSYVEGALSKVVDLVRAEVRVSLDDYDIEML